MASQRTFLLLGLLVLALLGGVVYWVVRGVRYVATEVGGAVSEVAHTLDRLDPLDSAGVRNRPVVLAGDTIGRLLLAFAVKPDSTARPRQSMTPARDRVTSRAGRTVMALFEDSASRVVFVAQGKVPDLAERLARYAHLTGRLRVGADDALVLDTVPPATPPTAELWLGTGFGSRTPHYPLVLEASVE
ncbi:MAG: hypothetical protein IPK12_10165 [Gemmatimonadetes bacterium]|nr:hypothetical protein [Gemmatimonadota bacterium]